MTAPGQDSARPLPQFDSERNIILLGESRLVFHCHHYNLFLQRTIEDALEADGPRIQTAAAAEAAREMLGALYEKAGDKGQDVAERLVHGKELFASLGFGLCDTSGLFREGGRVKLITSHYAIGYKAKWGAAHHPVCHFAVGFWMGALAAATGLAPERVHGKESACAAAGAPACELEIEVL